MKKKESMWSTSSWERNTAKPNPRFLISQNGSTYGFSLEKGIILILEREREINETSKIKTQMVVFRCIALFVFFAIFVRSSMRLRLYLCKNIYTISFLDAYSCGINASAWADCKFSKKRQI